ncbi:MAG TPA: alpha/beta fold hydrolase [Planctomycetota bacterium]
MRVPTHLEERDFRLDDEHDPLRTIRGRLAYPGGAEEAGAPLACVLVLHGFKGFMDWGFYPALVRTLVARGLAVVRFNFSGSGVGDDPERFSEEAAFFANTPSREVDDVERVRAWLDTGAVPWIDARRAALLGHSLGGAVALIHAARRADYRALVGWASCATFRRFPPEVEALWRRQGHVEIPNLRTKEVHRLGLGWLEDLERNARALDVLGAARRLTTPALFLHGSADEAVPLSEGRAILAACAPGVADLEVVEGASHTFWADHPLSGMPPALAHVLRRSADFLAARCRARA